MHTDVDVEVLIIGVKRLLSENSDSPLSNICKKFKNYKQEDWSKENVSILINDLSSALLQPTCTVEVATRFPQLVIPLLSLRLESSKHKRISHKTKCVALGKLVTLHPDTLRCAVKFFEDNGAPWEDPLDTADVSTPAKKRKKDDKVSDFDIALTCLNFLQASASHFRNIWKWSSFVKNFIDHECFKVRWAVCTCITMVVCMDETQYCRLINTTISSEELEACLLEVGQRTNYNNLLTKGADKNAGDSDLKVATSKMGITQLFQSVVTVSGITLPVFDIKKQVTKGSLVLVQSTVSNLRSAALGVACGKAVCLMGPVGCGKTAIVEHLADVTGRVSAPHLLKVQVGDETDAKMLLGSYRCTDVPGEFIWQPGVLTQAVLGGHWLLLEDIDSAPSDVVAVLACLLETGTISVPGFKDNLTPTPGFQIFFTYRLFSNTSGNYQLHSMASELLEKNWLQVNVEPLSKNELIHIVQVKFPVLKTIATKMVTLYLMFSSGDHEELPELVKRVSRSGRQISTRDLMKWCSRAEMGFDVSSPESGLKVLQDAIDIFCCSVGDGEIRMELARKVAACLGIIETKADFFCKSHKPNVNLTRNKCTAGRIVLPILESDTFECRRQEQMKFAFTRPASSLVERVAVCLSLKEPVLLVGETGTGKTSTLQLLARHTGHKLVVLNMNQQSDSTDLLGGFKPVDVKQVLSPIRDEFEALFRGYFSVEQNLKFLEHISTCFTKKRWDVLLRLMKHSQRAAVKRLILESGEETQSKLAKWHTVGEKINKLEIQLKQGQMALAFTFIEGSLVRALKEVFGDAVAADLSWPARQSRGVEYLSDSTVLGSRERSPVLSCRCSHSHRTKGHWVLLDEINLASAEALQCLSGLLEGGSGSLSLLERGDTSSVPRHPEFRLMAAMNPATDVGKKDLPPGIRNRFTELFVDELTDRTDLCLLVSCYLPDLQPSKVDAVVRFYLDARSEAETSLSDATGHKPHYSLRTLCRALAVAANNPCGNMQRSLHSALSLSFLTQLDTKSHRTVQARINRAVIEKGDIQSVLKQPIPEPLPRGSHISVEGYWVAKGKLEPVVPDKYILTSCVRRNLQDLVRSVSLSLYPILLQGDTCVGKTSLITYLAHLTGNKCVRINNHEHTDLQEYIGSYCADPSTGNLVFKEGVLVEAMRQGHWIILDELNLAPTDVLEALNRVLDDNRELYIPETQQTIKADPHFRLFATQNPPGLYGGRKVLSRAFRNRFIELHFNEIPGSDLEIILQQRCDMPASYSKKLVAVMTDLQTRRRGSAAFAGKQGFVTLRDLFRWGERYRLANQTTGTKFYDWDQHIADEGYLVLAGRVRKFEECEIIRQVIEKHIKRKVDPEKLFTLNSDTSPVTKHILEKHVGSSLPPQFKHIFWTFNLRRLAVLIGKAYEFKEPVLLVGETGCGKTTVSQLIGYNNGQKLLTVNCHQHSESSDFLGGLRPVRDHSAHDDGTPAGRLFEWVDGPLIEAMIEGQVFLADEISLADDSVLERLNSLLEPERTLLLSEKGTAEEEQQVVAADKFRFIGTMNPGGDFGKKELSPALRNRLTEIWCESISDRFDWISIIEHNVRQGFSLGNQEDGTSGIGSAIMDFVTWFKTTDIGKRVTVSVRDILMWVQFINTCALHDTVITDGLDIASAYIHGGCLVLIDSLGAGSTGIDKPDIVNKMRQACLEFLINQMETLNMLHKDDISYFYNKDGVIRAVTTKDHFGIPPFFIKKGNLHTTEKSDFTLGAGTTCMNACRVLRGLQLPGRAILLEGSPGVGKTSLVTALAQAAGYPVTRINLSDQTDVSDLFGADLPVEGAPGGTFAWRDGPLLRALKNNHWILLDELNLASQSVLEGLNAVLDHRGELFIPELGKTFHINASETKLFACQNPLRQGGARRGLPQSFLNRFTQVFIDPLTSADLLFIISTLFPKLPTDLVKSMVRFNERLSSECGVHWANKGAPWEMNLRDLTRWAQAMKDSLQPGKFVGIIYADRMRTLQDKQKVLEVYEEELGKDYPVEKRINGLLVTTTGLLLGDVLLPRMNCTQMYKVCQNGDKISSDILTNIVDRHSQLVVLRNQLRTLRSLAICIENNWMAILVGRSGSGKTSVVRLLSQLCGRQLRVLAVNSAMDTTEILGGFEQADHGRHLDQISEQIGPLVFACVQQYLLVSDIVAATDLLSQWEKYTELTRTGLRSSEMYTLSSALELFEKRITQLLQIVNKLGLNTYTNKLQNDLNILLNRVQSEGGLNTGGTFEWVDSILVKCLQEGSWLLIDNVNLCSCAVLDRLNALLEPGGVLSLGERGVDSEGKVVTIKPHPDFRLFLAMDPRHGEISRAMRNRGVEICLLSPEEKPLHSLDLEAMLYETGLTQKNHQTALKNIHNAMVENEFGFDSPTLNSLLHTATLIVQHWLRGQPLAQSFETCCKNVYVKARHFTLEQKQRAFEVLSEVLKSQQSLLHDCNSETSLSCLQSDLATVRTLAVQESSSLAMLKQQGALIAGILKAFSCDPHETLTLRDLLGSEITDLKGHSLPYTEQVKITNIVHHILLSFYSKATKRDVTTRNNWIEFLAKTNNHKDSIVVHEISNNLSKLLTEAFSDGKFSNNTSSDILLRNELPWDRRRTLLWDCSEGWSIENKIVLLMHVTLQNQINCIGQEQVVTKKKKIHGKNMTVSKFSHAFSKGELSDLAVNYTVVIEFSPLITRLNEYLDVVLTSELSQTVNSEQFGQLLATLHWKHRLTKVGENQLFVQSTGSSNLPEVSEHILMILKIHYRWLIKWLLPLLMYLIRNEQMLQEHEVTVKLLNTVSRIESSIYNDVSPLLSVAKSVGNILDKPLPRSSISHAQATQTLISLQKAITVFEGATNIKDLQRVLNFVVSAEGKCCRMKLIKAQILLEEGGHCSDEVSSLLKDVEDECLKHHLIKTVYYKENDQNITVKKKFIPEVAMWPVHEVFYLYLTNMFRHFLTNTEEPRSSGEISGNDLVTLMLNWSQDVSSIPTNAVALLRVAKNNMSNKNVTCSFSLMTALMQQYTVSAPFTNFRLWLHWNNDYSKCSDAENEMMDYRSVYETKEKLSINSPLLSLFVTSLISQKYDVDEGSSAEVTSLSSYEDKKTLITSIKDMLWRSGPAVTTQCFANSINEEGCIRQLFNKLISSLKISLQEKGYLEEMRTETSIEDCVTTDVTELILNALKQFVNERKAKQYLRPVTINIQKEDCVTVLSDNIIKLRDLLLRNKSNVDQPHQLWMSISEAWVLLGLVNLLIFSCIDLVDPVYKRELKLQYAIEEREYLKHTLIAEELQSIIQNTEDFPFKSLFEDRISYLMKREDALKKSVAVRPDTQVFTQLYRELAHVTSSICSSTAVSNLVNKLTSAAKDSKQDNVDRCLKEAEGWMYSVTRSVTNLHNNYSSWFPDIVIPIINSLTQMSYGIHLMSDTVHKISLTRTYLNDSSSLTSLIQSIGQFPIPDIETAFKMVKEISLTSSLAIIDKAFENRCEEDIPKPDQSNRLAKFCLRELCNIIAVQQSLEGNKEVWSILCSILSFVVASWQKQEELRKQKEKEEESYFINKVRKPIENLSEEEELELDVEKLFLTQKYADFVDLEAPSLEEKKKPVSVECPENEKVKTLTNKEMNEICQIHTNIVTQNTKAHWICSDDKHSTKADFMTAFLDRFSLCGSLLESYCEICYNVIDHKLLPALCLATHNFINIGNENAELRVGRKQYDFYHHSNVSEVKECISILKTITARVEELLIQWPDNPNLNQMNIVIDRIQNFAITSPVSRYLTGLELLLTKMHEWEQNAYVDVSLAPCISVVTNQILKWRKLELVCWKGSLESSAKRMQEDTSKWWFHLYSLIASYDKSDSEVTDKEVGTDEQLITALEQFMESSVLGDFQARLQLLFTFHCHVLNSTSSKKEQICSIFWNMYQYYFQFSAVIKSRLHELTLPVEKKLRDYVKIAKWNDINYWSVKGTIEKTHRTVMKYIKEYETILKLPVTDAMTKLHVPVKHSSELKTMPDLYIANIKLKEIAEPKEEDKLLKLCNNLSRGTSLFLKARKLCKELIQSSETSSLIYTIDCIADELYDSSQELKNLDVNRTLPKEKQKSEAKSILQRKRKNLSDTFRTLQTMGLSYRAGIIVYRGDTEGSSSFATIPPLDIAAALGQMESRSADRELLTAWEGCKEYYFHSIALLAQLRAAIAKPHKDIGPPIIERCKGFTMHLMKLCQDQRKEATHSCQLLYMLRCQIKQLTASLDDKTELPKQLPEILSLTKMNIIETLNSGEYCLHQFLLVLDACPEQETRIPEGTTLHFTNKLLPDSLMSPAMSACKYDNVWQEIKNSVNECLKLVGKLKDKLTVPDKSVKFIKNLLKVNAKLTDCYTDVSVVAQYGVIVDSLESLSDVKTYITKIISLFEMKLKHSKELHPLTECISLFENNIEKCLSECKTMFGLKVAQESALARTRSQVAKLTTQVILDYENTIGGFINTILLAIQEVYKRDVKTSENPKTNMGKSDQKEADFTNELVESHLKEKIVNNIFSEIKLLKIETVNKEIMNVTTKLATMVNWDNRKVCKGILRCCIPLLEQYYLLLQYLVTQQISALKVSVKLCSNLLSIFTDLALKGFRIPEDLLDEGEQGDSQTLGGMGLGEGEGEKDVSDQIESQDQLEDAKPAGQEKEEEDKECKEEEKGIEMSDDFGGKLQDIEEKEKENSDEESEKEEEPDKEMGDTEQGADTLDQQLWGSDTEEEEDEDDKESKEEQGNTGEQVGEKDYGPKDESKEPQDDDEDDKHKSEDKKKEINEMEEPNEDDDQVDPYHGKHQPEVEPEPLDLPENLDLDNEEQKDEDQEEENPFDIDAMKEPKLPDDQPEDEEMKESQEKEENPNESDTSDEDAGEKEDIPDTQNDEENADDGGKKDEDKTGEENKPEDGNAENRMDEETAKPSEDAPSVEPTVGSDQDAGSKDQVSQSEDKSKEMKPEENAASEGPDTQGVGTAEKKDEENMKQGTQGCGDTKVAPVKEKEVQELKKRHRPGESDEQRVLGNVNEPKQKKLKTVNKESESEQNRDETQEEGMKQEANADIYQHIKEAKDVKYDAQTLDSATDEQAEKQPKLKEGEEDVEAMEDDQNVPIDEDEQVMETEEIPTLPADDVMDLTDEQKKKEEKKAGQAAKDNFDGDIKMEVEGEIIQTSTVVRGNESTIHTQLSKLDEEFQKEMDVQELRTKIEEQLASWSQPPLSDEAEQAWDKLCTVTSSLSRDLSEQLRLVLEPTQASRLKGDFRTGRRINMRKVIPYIASQFRKDKIWLRRTKPSKREYQIVLAIDDSSSMADNHSKELAFESLAVVSKALTLLEAGDLAVLSFGEKTEVLHQLGNPFTEQSGARLLQQFSFEQQKTKVGELVNFACTLLSRHGPSRSGSEFAQLLIIVSDGRGVFNDGEAKVAAAIRRAKHQGVFMVFIVIDNPTSKDSILDIRMPKFSGSRVEITSYMDSFPFPFYLILRDINNLPAVLSDALRQWFELVTSVTQ